MINEIDILHKGHCSDFACHAGEKSAGLLCVISYHHKIVIELREYRFDTFSESFVRPGRRSPILLIQPIRNLQSDICNIEEALLYLSTKVALVSKHQAVMIFPLHIFEIMEVVDTCGSHVIGMNHSAYSTDCMEFISIIVQSLRCTISPIGSNFRIVLPHDATFCSCVLADLDRFRVNAENILSSIDCHCYIFLDFFSKTSRQLTPGIELSSTNQVWQIIFALVVQAMKQEILTIEARLRQLCQER